MKIIAEERQPSGSGRVSRRKKWRFHDQMSFIRDTLLHKPTISNESQRQSFSEEDASNSSQTDKSSSRNWKDSIERMAEAISTPLPSVKLPPMPQVTEFGIVVATKLKICQKEKATQQCATSCKYFATLS
ncbi:uncharacterized protein [Temnothorax nylanderi]|uniref:uncharacterized protein n=1 Tax=Temnothorax nylanderi TaxID=102681 RepID=UPI003A87257B